MAGEHNGFKSGAIGLATDFGLGEDENGITRLSETLQGVVDIFGLPEYHLHRRSMRFARKKTVAAGGAGRLSGFQVLNPIGSRVLAVIESIASNCAFGDLELAVDSASAFIAILNPVDVKGVANDTRYPLVGETSICTIRTGDFPAGVSLPQHTATTIQEGARVPLGYVLKPGSSAFAIRLTANSAFTFEIVFRERPLYPGEQRG